jgi:hypothetical protein
MIPLPDPRDEIREWLTEVVRMARAPTGPNGDAPPTNEELVDYAMTSTVVSRLSAPEPAETGRCQGCGAEVAIDVPEHRGHTRMVDGPGGPEPDLCGPVDRRSPAPTAAEPVREAPTPETERLFEAVLYGVRCGRGAVNDAACESIAREVIAALTTPEAEGGSP